jgi:hypothetical protein
VEGTVGASDQRLQNQTETRIQETRSKPIRQEQTLEKECVLPSELPSEQTLERERVLPILALREQTRTSKFGRQIRPKKVFGEAITTKATANEAVALTTLDHQPLIPVEVISVKEALQDDKEAWMESIKNELKALKETGTYKIMFGEVPKGRKLISSKLVLRNKIHENGSLARRKARLVIRGFEQTAGMDYFETFASVIRYSTLRVLLALAAFRDLEIEQVDIDTAFLNPILKEEIYMETPEFFTEIHPELKGHKGKVYLKLLRSLYGLKQAPREWWLMVKEEMEKLGLQGSEADPNLFILPPTPGRQATYVLVFVDDMLIIGTVESCNFIKSKILTRWKGKNLGPARVFVGLQIERNRVDKTIRIHQTLYTRKMIEKFGMDKANGVKLPAKAGTVLRKLTEEEKLEIVTPDEIQLYQQIVGSMIYLANLTRPDISYIVGQLARHMAAPTTEYLQFTKPLLRYCKETMKLGIEYGGGDGHNFDVYTDSTWGTEDDRKSFQGWVIKYNGGATSWAANRQKSTALSSQEAEIMAASDGAREAAWMLKLWKDLEIKPTRIPILYLDNQGAESLAKERKYHAKTKHIDIRHFYIREDMVKRGKLAVQHIAGDDNMADTLTKALPIPTFERYRQYMGIK